LIVADTGSHTIRVINNAGEVSVIAGIAGQPGSTDGNIGEASFNAPIGVVTDKNGRIYIADTYNDRIRVIENGIVSTLAGSTRGFADGSGESVKFDTPTGLAMWQGRLLVADTGNGRIRALEPDGRVWTLTGFGPGNIKDGLLSQSGLSQPSAIAVGEAGVIYFTDGNAVRYIDGSVFPKVQTISSVRRGILDDVASRSKFNRPSGLAVLADGSLLAADSENGLVRRFSAEDSGKQIKPDQIARLRGVPAEFRITAPPRWPYDPPQSVRDIAGTLGEIRGEISEENDHVWFHNGLDIAGAYGETARFMRDEKVLRPQAAENFGTLRELLRMPSFGYVHIRLGRDRTSLPYDDSRFLFEQDPSGKLTNVRIPRGSKFTAGERIGSLNAMNHVHLVAGRSGQEMNALDALILPGLSDSRPPTIEKVTFFDENWREIETSGEKSRINLTGKIRVTVRAYDQMDGNPDRRRLGLHKLGYQVFRSESQPADQPVWTISFDRLPPPESVPLVYAIGSRSGATGVTIFNYIVTNKVAGDNASEGFIDTDLLDNGIYTLRVYAADYFGNTSTKDIPFEVNK
jgi:sugar lactone lactonase YvrE